MIFICSNANKVHLTLVTQCAAISFAIPLAARRLMWGMRGKDGNVILDQQRYLQILLLSQDLREQLKVLLEYSAARRLPPQKRASTESVLRRDDVNDFFQRDTRSLMNHLQSDIVDELNRELKNDKRRNRWQKKKKSNAFIMMELRVRG